VQVSSSAVLPVVPNYECVRLIILNITTNLVYFAELYTFLIVPCVSLNMSMFLIFGVPSDGGVCEDHGLVACDAV
jgi:hypothetical protein